MDSLNISDPQVKTIVFKKGQTLFVQGHLPHGLFCIKEGNVKLTRSYKKNKESILQIATKGEVLGYQNILTDEKFSCTATAMEKTEVCFLNKKHIMDISQNNSPILLLLIKQLSQIIRINENKIFSHHHKNVRERLAEFLHSLIATHGSKEGHGTRINISITRVEIAAIIGTSKETLMRLMAEFKDLGIIEQKGKVLFIKDEQVLYRHSKENNT
jgi:CRP-like cAMP-binding protein